MEYQNYKMNLKPYVKEFIKQNIDKIQKSDWETLYYQRKGFNNNELTETLLEAGIDPLNDVIKVPHWYLRYSNVPTQITLPSNITIIGEYAFANCQNLKSIQLSSNIIKLEDRCFFQDHKLENIQLPPMLECIDRAVFGECYKLKSIIIPETVKEIYTWAFAGCKNLTQVKLPRYPMHIESMLFDGCDNLLDVEYSGTKDNFKEYYTTPVQQPSGKYLYFADAFKHSKVQIIKCIDGILRISTTTNALID